MKKNQRAQREPEIRKEPRTIYNVVGRSAKRSMLCVCSQKAEGWGIMSLHSVKMRAWWVGRYGAPGVGATEEREDARFHAMAREGMYGIQVRSTQPLHIRSRVAGRRGAAWVAGGTVVGSGKCAPRPLVATPNCLGGRWHGNAGWPRQPAIQFGSACRTPVG